MQITVSFLAVIDFILDRVEKVTHKQITVLQWPDSNIHWV